MNGFGLKTLGKTSIQQLNNAIVDSKKKKNCNSFESPIELSLFVGIERAFWRRLVITLRKKSLLE